MKKKLSSKEEKLSLSKKRNSSTDSKKISSEPQTMEELLTQLKKPIRGWRVGDLVEGVVIEKTNKVLYLDIGGKSEGMVIDREMKAAADFIKKLAVGDKVLAVVTQPENDKGQTLLSLKPTVKQKAWDEFEENLKTGQTIKVKAFQINKGGLLVEVNEIQGFIPASQISSSYANRVEELLGKELEVKVIEVNREKNRLVFSEKAVSEAEILKEQEEILKKVKTGDILEGEVSGIMPFGLFVKVGFENKKEKKTVFLEGLVHISEISWEKVNDPSKFYKQGDKVKVKVLNIDKTSGRLNLSIKQLLPDPWQDIEKKYPVEKKVKGKVVRLAPFGVFINLEKGIEGLIHISKIPVERSFKIGEEVDCFIEFLDKENRRLSLGLVLKEKPVGYK